MKKPDGFYVARCARCGNMAVSIADHQEWKKETARELASVVRRGWTVEHLTYAQVQAMPFRMCECKGGALKSGEKDKPITIQTSFLEALGGR